KYDPKNYLVTNKDPHESLLILKNCGPPGPEFKGPDLVLHSRQLQSDIRPVSSQQIDQPQPQRDASFDFTSKILLPTSKKHNKL
uniref:Uncharacterized protein n=1 Tax=Sinocyclocheilus grahami TaxID=75366 RepID=A0A672LA82_SINGR